MALNDLTGQNIQDTYKKLVQTEGNTFADGSGSAITTFNVTSSHAVSASYALSASHEITYELSSSHAVNADTASFATNFTASGNISSSGYIYGDQYYSNGGGIAYDNGTTTFYGNTKLTEIDGTNIKLDAPVTVSGNISASGNLIVNNINGTINGGTF